MNMNDLAVTGYNLIWYIFKPFWWSLSVLCPAPFRDLSTSSSERTMRNLHLKARLGMMIENLALTKPGALWIHALSAGEVLSALPLAKTLCSIRKHAGITLPLIMSASTLSGFNILTSSGLSLDEAFIMPLDAPWLMTKLVNRIRPSIFVLIEGDVWPNLLRSLKSVGTRCFLVNARMSPASFLGYKRLNKLGINIFSYFDAIFLASPNMRRFYCEFVDESKVFFLGNLKWDAAREKAVPVEERSTIMEELGIAENTPVWIAGSVHAGEEEAILRAHKKILSRIPDAILMLAPRNVPGDVERFEKVCTRMGFTVVKRSGGERVSRPATVYLIDTLGELMRFYSIANVAFVGGSLIPKGGHNLMEPAIYGIPVCWGPYVFNFQDIAENLENSEQGAEVNARTLPDFILQRLLATQSLHGSSRPSRGLFNSGSPTVNVLSEIFNMVLSLF